MFPSPNNKPARFFERVVERLVTSLVFPYLREPVLTVRLGLCAVGWVTVPKATVNKHRYAGAPKNHVGSSSNFGKRA